jgi:hypothetical protein
MSDTGHSDRQPDMGIDQIHDKSWRIEVLQGEPGWKTLVYHPGALLPGAAALDGPDRRAILEEVKMLKEEKPGS